MCRLPAAENQWGFILATRCLYLAAARIVYRMFWWKKLLNSILNFIIQIRIPGF